MQTPMNLKDKYTKITIALAGVFQAAYLVDQLANTGECDEAAFQTSINSLFKLKASDVPSVFDGAENLQIGYKELCKVFNKGKTEKPNAFVSRYALSLIMLLKQLHSNPAMLADIRKRIEHAITQKDYFNEVNDTVIANLADIYMKSISTFRNRIQIIGKAPHLQNEIVANKVRALLLAGIRSAMLWQQVGGQRWQLFFVRNKMYKIARGFL